MKDARNSGKNDYDVNFRELFLLQFKKIKLTESIKNNWNFIFAIKMLIILTKLEGTRPNYIII